MACTKNSHITGNDLRYCKILHSKTWSAETTHCQEPSQVDWKPFVIKVLPCATIIENRNNILILRMLCSSIIKTSSEEQKKMPHLATSWHRFIRVEGGVANEHFIHDCSQWPPATSSIMFEQVGHGNNILTEYLAAAIALWQDLRVRVQFHEFGT